MANGIMNKDYLGIEFDNRASKRPSFPDPGPLPEELTHVPGFIGKLADFFRNNRKTAAGFTCSCSFN